MTRTSKLLTAASLAAAVALGGAAAAQEKIFVSIGANPVGNTAYQWAAGIADVVNNNVKGVEATAEGTQGYVANIRLLLDDKIEAGFSNSKVGYEAATAQGDYKDAKKGHIQSWLYLAPIIMQVFTLEGSDIKTLADLKSKRVGMGQPGGTSMIDAEILFEAAGLKPGEDFKDFRVKLGQMAEMLGNGQLDAVVWNGSIPLPPIIQLNAQHDIRFVQIPDEVSEKIRAKYPSYFEIDLPANTYEDQKEAVNSYGLGNVLMIRSDVSKEVVYNMTKAIMENLQHLRGVHPAFKNLTKESVLTGLKAPLHPGALRYYDEIGVSGLDAFKETASN